MRADWCVSFAGIAIRRSNHHSWWTNTLTRSRPGGHRPERRLAQAKTTRPARAGTLQSCPRPQRRWRLALQGDGD